MAALSSARLKKRRLRSRARIQRSTTSTADFDLGLVARVRRPRGQHRAAVVLGELLVGPVGIGS